MSDVTELVRGNVNRCPPCSAIVAVCVYKPRAPAHVWCVCACGRVGVCAF
eukprot:m.260740 g.260740  ORF g.260740 m.260740 type:complete len:50 (-) comp15565_c1_seq5:126-275(-)